MKYIINQMGIAEKQELEVAKREQEKQAAKLDYIAMMTDVDLDDILMSEEETTDEQ